VLAACRGAPPALVIDPTALLDADELHRKAIACRSPIGTISDRIAGAYFAHSAWPS